MKSAVNLHELNNQYASINNIKYILGTILTGENVRYFSNPIDMSIYEDYINSEKNYNDYDLQNAIAMNRFDLNYESLEVLSNDSITWFHDTSINNTEQSSRTKYNFAGLILLENISNNICTGVKKSDNIDTSDTFNCLDFYYYKFNNFHKYFDQLNITWDMVMCIDGLNWVNLSQFTMSQRNTDLLNDIIDKGLNLRNLEDFNYRSFIGQLFNSNIS